MRWNGNESERSAREVREKSERRVREVDVSPALQWTRKEKEMGKSKWYQKEHRKELIAWKLFLALTC